jgi:hypothetical protein
MSIACEYVDLLGEEFKEEFDEDDFRTFNEAPYGND